MSRTCHFCGEGANKEKGTPAKYTYQGRTIFAHVDCANAAGIGDSH